MSDRPTDEHWRMATGYASPGEANAALLKQAEQLKALADGLRAVSRTVGIARRRHLVSCVYYGGRVFDEYTSACTAECAALRPALDLLDGLP